MGNFRVELEKVACQSFGACVELCPQFFQLSDIDAKSTISGSKKITSDKVVVSEQIELDELNCIRAAAESCPFNAIHIINIETGEKLI
jgi:ferredoxin